MINVNSIFKRQRAHISKEREIYLSEVEISSKWTHSRTVSFVIKR